MRIIHPYLLLIIPAAAVILYLLARRGNAYRPRIHFAIRLLIVAAVALAMAGLDMRRPDYSQDRIFVLDVSESTGLDTAAALDQIASAARKMDRRDRIAVIAFGREPAVEFEPGSPRTFDLKQVRSAVTVSATDIEAALALARSLHEGGRTQGSPLRDDGRTQGLTPRRSGHGTGQIVLVTDGNETRGSLQREVLRLAADGLPVYCVPVERGGPDLRVRIADSPQSVRPNDVFRITAEVAGTGRVKITARPDDGAGAEDLLAEDLLAVRGSTLWSAEFSFAKPGLHRIEVAISSAEDSYPQNNTAAAAVWVAGPPSLLWVSRAASTLAAAVGKAGYTVTVTPPERVPAAASDLQGYDAVILDDCPRWALPRQALDAIKCYVHDLGGGLVMLGGAGAFGPGGYIGSPVEAALPVTCDPQEQSSKPAALAVVIDRSGTMTEQVSGSGRSKLSFAQEGLALVLDQLKEQDRIAVVAFHGVAEVVWPLGSASRKDDVLKQVAALTAGGTTNLNAGLEAALKQLAAADPAMARHAIVLSDGLPQEKPDVAAWARRFTEQKISVSTLATGDKADKALLQGLAEATGGKFYLVESIERIPDILMADARPSGGTLLKQSKDGFPVQLLDSPLTAGLPAPPRIGAYVLVKPKETARTAIEVAEGDALVATWWFGAGRSAAVMAPAGALADWQGAGPLWAAVLASAARPAGDPAITTTVHVEKGVIRVEVADAHADRPRDLRASIVGPRGAARAVRLQQTGPELYAGEMAAAEPGMYPISIVENSDNGTVLRDRAAAVVPYSPEWEQTRANNGVLSEISKATGGQVIKGLDSLALPEAGTNGFADVRWAAAILALVLFLVELALP